jgi:hypothetical protein
LQERGRIFTLGISGGSGEFLAKFKCSPGKANAAAQMVRVVFNQEGVPETVVVVPGDLGAPRIMSEFYEWYNSLEEDRNVSALLEVVMLVDQACTRFIFTGIVQ